MVEALGAAGPRGAWRRPLPLVSFVVLAAIVDLDPIAAAAGLAYSIYDADKQIFVGVHDPDAAPSPSRPVASLAPGQTAPPATPTPSAPTTPKRINILLTGIDSCVDPLHALNDTLLVVSIDPVTGSDGDGQLPARHGTPADPRRRALRRQDQLADDVRGCAARSNTPTVGWPR